MPDLLRVTRVRFSLARTATAPPGVVGYVSLSIPDFGQLDGLAVRLKPSGEPYLTFPTRRDSAGRRHAFLRPNRMVREAIERAVLGALRARGVLA